MEKYHDYGRQNGTPMLDAKIHQGYDPNHEFKEQGTLFSNVVYDKGDRDDTSLLEQIAQAVTETIENIMGDGSNIGEGTYGLIQETSPGDSIDTIGKDDGVGLGDKISTNISFDDGAFGGGGYSSPVDDGNSPDGTGLTNSSMNSGVSQPSPASSSNSPEFPNPSTDDDPGDDDMLSAPVINTQPANGDENDPIPLLIQVTQDSSLGVTTSVTLFGVPVGAILSAGINNGNGSWTLTPAQLVGLTLTPPDGFSGGIGLSVLAVSTLNGTSVSTSKGISISVEGVATLPNLDTQPASGDENSAIPLTINASLVDNDGSETLSITIGNVPAGAVLSAGINNGNGTWTLTPAQLIGLTITPPADSGDDFVLNVTATSSENGTTSSVSDVISVTVGAVASSPFLTVQNATGLESTPIALDINAALSDTDGSETLSITIGNVPAGAVLSAGINNGNGTWTLTPAQLTGLTITPPTGSEADFTLTVTATSSENGTTANVSQNLNITVEGVATPPNLIVQDASGDEGSAIPLTINASLVDNDGSETLSITIGNVPAGAVLSAGINNGDGTWTLTPAQLAGLTITPPAGSDADFTLTVTATSSENGTTSSVSDTIDVEVGGLANPPLLSVVATANGAEDTAISLVITSDLTDNDGSESLSIVISGLPDGAILSSGLYTGGGKWSLNAADLAGLTLTPPQDFSGAINLTVTAVVTESNGDTSEVSAPCVVTVTPVADAPNLDVHAAIGLEDQSIALDIMASLNDTDGSEILSVTITGVPSGVILSAGINNGGGSWTLTPAQLAGLYLTAPFNNADDFTLNVSAIARESDNTISVQYGTVQVAIEGVADMPTVFASSVAGVANTNVALNIGGNVIDMDGSEHVTFLIEGVPDGFALTAGLNNGDNTWTLTAAQLAGLAIIPPYDFEGRVHLAVRAIAHEAEGDTELSAPANFSVGFGNADAGTQINLLLNIGIGGIGIGVGVGVGIDLNLGDLLNPDGFTGMEGSTIQISNGASLLTTVVGVISSLEFRGVPAGASFNHGTNIGGGVWQMSTADLTNLQLTLPADNSTDFTLSFWANVLFLLPVQLAVVPVHVVGVADVPSLVVNDSSGVEDATSGIALNVTAALNDIDGSERLSILIKDLPAGSHLSAGIDNGNGTWSLTAAELAGLRLFPPENFSGTITYTVYATTTENEGDSSMVSATGQVTVTSAADIVTAHTLSFQGSENQAVALNWDIALQDTDGSENIASIVISGMPAGASLVNATDNGDGTWSVNIAQLNNVQFVPPMGWHGDAVLGIAVISQELSNGTQTSWSGSVNVHVEAVADAPTVGATDASGFNDAPIDLSITAGLVDTDGSESLSIVIGGVPDGCVLSAGLNNNDGTWTLQAGDLSGLQIMAPEGFSGDIALSITSYAVENSNGDAANSATIALNVHVDEPPLMMSMMMGFSGGPEMDALNTDANTFANDNAPFADDLAVGYESGQHVDSSFNDHQGQAG